MQLPSLLTMLKREHLPEEQQCIFDTIGEEAYKKLLLHFGGGNLYLPRPTSIANLVRAYIVRHYSPELKDKIARELGLTPRHVSTLAIKSFSLQKTQPFLHGNNHGKNV